MNYRNIIKSRDLRVKILTFLSWIPDSIMLRLQYRLQTGRKLNLKNPKRFTEKLQVYKLKYRNPDMLRCTDKYEVRKYIEEKGFTDYLIPLIGIYDKVEDIDYSELPNKFVAKSTDGGGGNQVLVCKDKSLLSEANFKARLNGWMSVRKVKKQSGREWAYENEYPRRILIEQLIGAADIKKDIPDYKFFCFAGEPRFLYMSDTPKHELIFFDLEWNVLPFGRKDYKPYKIVPSKPRNLNKMIEIARELSKGFPHVRVDLYNVEDNVYFGELTFYTASGYIPFDPDSADFDIGKLFDLDSINGD